ncbi:MAG: NfeD family protein, partial [Rhizorhabdus sp.]|nr:NfeD family protein [Rhizorhabdus sp.]
VAAVASIYGGRTIYRRSASPPDPLLNHRAVRMIGTRVTISEAIVQGRGRATVGDGSWLAEGPDMAVGTAATVVSVEGNTLSVVPIS